MSRRVVAALLAGCMLVVGACSSSSSSDVVDRPAHLLDVPPGSVERIEVRDPSTGRVAGGPPSAELAGDLAPLLAVRELPSVEPEYGLDPPRLEVTVKAGGRRHRLLLGGATFDGSGFYVSVGGRTAIVLERVGEGLLALLNGAPG